MNTPPAILAQIASVMPLDPMTHFQDLGGVRGVPLPEYREPVLPPLPKYDYPLDTRESLEPRRSLLDPIEDRSMLDPFPRSFLPTHDLDVPFGLRKINDYHFNEPPRFTPKSMRDDFDELSFRKY